MNDEIKEKINRRRRQLLVHSYIYYELNQNIIDDMTWSKWAMELKDLQEKYPEESSEVPYADEFKGWDGSTGAYLIYDSSIRHLGKYLLKLKEGKE